VATKLLSVSQLFLYPVKSLRGFSIDQTTLTATGFEYDRHWMIVNNKGHFITQRQFPQMVLIQTAIENGNLVLCKTGMQPLHIPLADTHLSTEAFETKIWRDTCRVIEEGQTASQWLTEAIGTPKPVKLVRMLRDTQRPQSNPELLGENTHTHFADAAPYLVCNLASLNKVNDALLYAGLPKVTIENFRPNIVIEGLDAFVEHSINELQHNEYRFKFCYACERCIIPTIDINTGKRNPAKQPFSLIAEINSMPENPRAPAFGENAILTVGHNQTIHTSDQLTAIEK
jgi:uncharacterized protein YcbX